MSDWAYVGFCVMLVALAVINCVTPHYTHCGDTKLTVVDPINNTVTTKVVSTMDGGCNE